MQQFICFVLLLGLPFSCRQQVKFDKSKWMEGDAGIYPYRESMLNDLLAHKIKGMHYKELIKLAGEPNGVDNHIGSRCYDIVVDYGSDVDPVYTKTLTVYLNKDSVITGYKVREWKKQ